MLYNIDKLLELTPNNGIDAASTAASQSVSTDQIDANEALEMAEIAAAESIFPPSGETTGAVTVDNSGTMCVFFPDMGATALARRDWKLGWVQIHPLFSNRNDLKFMSSLLFIFLTCPLFELMYTCHRSSQSEAPPSVRTANIQNDILQATDKLAIMLCPLSYEIDSVMRVKDMCEAANVPCIMINPNLINMDQGLGYRARDLRNKLISPYTMMYKLKTLSNGAIVRKYPQGYSLWLEDEKVEEGGYRLLRSFVNEPPNEVVADLLSIHAPPCKEDVEENVASRTVKDAFKGVSSFFDGLSKM